MAAAVPLGRWCLQVALNHPGSWGAALSCLTGGGWRQVLSAWVPVGCHPWLALGFLWAEPGARRAEGEPCERVRADPCIPLGRSQPAG